jgi:hypothetical protein
MFLALPLILVRNNYLSYLSNIISSEIMSSELHPVSDSHSQIAIMPILRGVSIVGCNVAEQYLLLGYAQLNVI